jgi:hypothetical protein
MPCRVNCIVSFGEILVKKPTIHDWLTHLLMPQTLSAVLSKGQHPALLALPGVATGWQVPQMGLALEPG